MVAVLNRKICTTLSSVPCRKQHGRGSGHLLWTKCLCPFKSLKNEFGRMGRLQCRASAVDMHRQERILRYPDGAVRTIRYPQVYQPEITDEITDGYDKATELPCDSDEESWGVCREGDSVCQNVFTSAVEDVLPGAAPHGLLWADELRAMLDETSFRSSSNDEASTSRVIDRSTVEETAQLPSSPAALLAFLQSPEYKEKQQATEQRVSKSYKILTGCPWLQPKPVLVIALRRPGRRDPEMYTLSTRIVHQGEASELARVLKDKRLESALSVERVHDGIICFERGDDAGDFQELLEVDGHLDVLVTEVDSHQLFRLATSVDAVVVLMGQGDMLPRPHQLAASLGGRTAMDEFL